MPYRVHDDSDGELVQLSPEELETLGGQNRVVISQAVRVTEFFVARLRYPEGREGGSESYFDSFFDTVTPNDAAEIREDLAAVLEHDRSLVPCDDEVLAELVAVLDMHEHHDQMIASD